MRTYRQYCPISRASEILAERWTPLVIRNVLLGCRNFNDIARGVPGMSRSLLTRRLRVLEEQGIIRSRRKEAGRGSVYEMTDAGQDLWDVINALAGWGQRWLDLRPEHSDPSIVLWAWAHVHVRRERLPRRRVVVRFTFPDEPRAHRRYWFLVERGELELCDVAPDPNQDVDVVARSVAFTHWHVGRLSWAAALRSGDIRVSGPTGLARALPGWNARALPVPATAGTRTPPDR